MPTILLIDDDVTLLSSLSEQLQEAGYATQRASDTSTATKLVQAHMPDMVLLDTDMERGAGWTLLEQLAPRVPVIVISARGLEEDVMRGLELGAADYLAKPFRSGELLTRMRVRLRGTQQNLAQPSVDTAPAGDSNGSRAPGFVVEPPMPVPVAPPSSAGHSTRRVVRRLGEGSSDGDNEQPVFISHNEEQQLFGAPEADQFRNEPRLGDVEHLPLGQRLRAARQNRRITLVQAELESKIRMHYIQAMEEEKFSLLPRGPYAEEILRTYANYLGLNAAPAVDEYRQKHYSAPVAPPPSLGGVGQPWRPPRGIVWAVAVLLALGIGCGGIRLLDPSAMPTLANRAYILVVPPTPTITPSPTPTPTITPTPTNTPLPTDTPLPTATPTPPPTLTPTPEPPTVTPTPTATPRRRR